ncbi:hypothetical protein PAPYR_2073 [Paratrimastix pyriformis]|uniref:Uncharacterized protein n=1 Tax=Paratrimastix pyriformis TaxID=342808 RepID=A0ABQ8UUR8_9EUKA|nr:hypothetical protein PAPYR_2073 [Paratrimastix pyriformis]
MSTGMTATEQERRRAEIYCLNEFLTAVDAFFANKFREELEKKRKALCDTVPSSAQLPPATGSSLGGSTPVPSTLPLALDPVPTLPRISTPSSPTPPIFFLLRQLHGFPTPRLTHKAPSHPPRFRRHLNPGALFSFSDCPPTGHSRPAQYSIAGAEATTLHESCRTPSNRLTSKEAPITPGFAHQAAHVHSARLLKSDALCDHGKRTNYCTFFFFLLVFGRFGASQTG